MKIERDDFFCLLKILFQLFQEAFDTFSGILHQAVDIDAQVFSVFVLRRPFNRGVFTAGCIKDLVGPDLSGPTEFVSADLPLIVAQFLGNDLFQSLLKLFVIVNGRQFPCRRVQL